MVQFRGLGSAGSMSMSVKKDVRRGKARFPMAREDEGWWSAIVRDGRAPPLRRCLLVDGQAPARPTPVRAGSRTA